VRPFLLAQALRQAGYGVEIVGFSADESPAIATDLPIHILPRPAAGLGLGAARALFRQLTGDILYAYKLKPSSFGLALVHRQLSLGRDRRPLLLDIDDWELSWHGGDGYRYRPTPRQLARDVLRPNGALRDPDHPLYLRWLEPWATRADRITTHNRFLQGRFGGDIIPNGKDTELFDPDRHSAAASRAALGLGDCRVLMFPGAPRPYKGLEDLLTALDLLNEPDLKLAIVGGSPYDDYDRTLLDRWGQHIVHLGQRPPAEMPGIIAAAHAIVVPQRQTAAAQAQFPLKLTDGMAMAKPILATRVGDIPEIVGDGGYLVEPDAPEQLAAGIQAIFSDYEQALERGRRGRDRCIAHYSLAAMAAGLDRVIQPLWAQHRG
jgi:glycosyltransferase involved in cell wall biosynthesis